MHEEQRRGDHRSRERHDEEPHDAKGDEQRRGGDDAQDQAPPCRRIGTDGGQVNREQRRGDALLGDEEPAARRPQHVSRRVCADADAAQDRRGRARDESGQREHAGTLEIERRGRDEQKKECRGEEGEPARWLRALADGRTGRDRFFCQRLTAIRQKHPSKYISGDRQHEDGGPDVEVKRVEPRRRCGRPSEGPNPHDVEPDDEDGAPGSPREASSPLHRIGEDSAKEERHRVCAAARKRDLDRKSRCAEHPHRRRCLRAGERQDSVRLDPAQAEHAEEAEAPRYRPPREFSCVRPGGGRVRRHGGSPAG